MDEKIILNDGTVLQQSHVILSGSNLFFYVQNGMGIIEVFNLFSDIQKTRKIKCERFGQKTEYIGYTTIMSIGKDDEVQISGRLIHE